MNARRLEEIGQEIERLKAPLAPIGIVRPGALTRPDKDPTHHTGASDQVGYPHRLKSRTAYGRARFVEEVRRHIRESRTLTPPIERWVALGREHSQLSVRLRSRQEMVPKDKP